MGKVKQKRERRHRIRNLPLAWSFMLYVLACIAVAATVSILAAAWFSGQQSDIYHRYEEEYLRSRGITEEELYEAMQVTVYSVDFEFSPEDAELYEFYSAMSLLSVPLLCLLCILLTGILFYRRKIRVPLTILDAASVRIAAGDLDFSVEYENRNEMGRLAKSFEIMRGALLENSKEMWRMMEERKRLNSAFTHDLRTPLTVLKGYTEYLRTYVPQQRVPEEKLLSTVDLMHTYITRLEGYTGSMSTVQKLEETRPNPQRISFDALCVRLRSAADILRGPSQMHFTCNGAGEICVDPDLIVQVMENLVSNASRFARREIRAGVLLCAEESTLKLSISDDGPGFTDAVLRKGASPYNYDKGQETMSSHLGLGLYICSILCERHGGSLVLPDKTGESKIIAIFRLLEGC